MTTIDELRQQVRAHLATMDETPAAPVKIDGEALLNEIWAKIARNPPTGRRRQFVKGRDSDEQVAAPLVDKDTPKPAPVRRKMPTLAEEYARQQAAKPVQVRQQTAPRAYAVKRACVRSASDVTTRARNFFAKVRQTHGDRYDYKRAAYVNAHTKIVIGCPLHGDFEQEP